ncbi:HAD-IB family hydrolase [Streptomyces sp. DH37]|uniref:HAD-IB family hydrolase n=1 Tax=Streptomyces sp. DH37 TaxID=3040122 RepID=UPI0024419514|nr:HAD-IB family hydrolase [Streptomyces sp. DH37]MDG9702551.1 HAD-IB family hydrolase [Streptomyces sp. DH37]
MPRTYRARDLAGTHVLVTGATERIEIAVLHRLVTAHPDTYVSVVLPPDGPAARSDPSTRDDALAPLLSRKAFGPWRDEVGAGPAMAEARRRVRVLAGRPGDVTLPAGIDVVVHCAPTGGPDRPLGAVYDEQITPLVALRGQWPRGRLGPHLVYVSQAGFSGAERGLVRETRLEHDLDWRREVALARALEDDAERLSRAPGRSRRTRRAAERAHRGAGPLIVAQEAEAARRAWVERRLVERGRARARALGHPHAQSLAAVLAERATEELWRSHPLTVLRPAPVGHALRRPYPGWSEGRTRAVPPVAAFVLLDTVAGSDATVLDTVPADLAADAVLAAAAARPGPDSPHYFHLGTATTRPLTLGELRAVLRTPFPTPRWRPPRRRPELPGVYDPAGVRYDDTELTALRNALPQPRTHLFDPGVIDWRRHLAARETADMVERLHAPVTRAVPTTGSRLPVAKEPTAAVFDLDGTIAASDLVESYLWTRLAGLPRRAWPAEFADLVLNAPRYLLAERADRARFVRAFLRRYAGTDEAALRRLVGEAVGNALLHRVRHEAVRRVRAHRAAGHRTVLVTGGLELLAEPLRPLFDDIEACRMRTRNGVMTGQVAARPPVGEARADWLRRYTAEHGLDPAHVYAYADSYSDRALLDAVGHPHAVDPDPRLLRHALRRRWPVLRWGAHTATRWEALAVAAGGAGERGARARNHRSPDGEEESP